MSRARVAVAMCVLVHKVTHLFLDATTTPFGWQGERQIALLDMNNGWVRLNVMRSFAECEGRVL